MNNVFAFDLSISCVGVSIFGNDGHPKWVGHVETKSEKLHQRKLKIIADYMLWLKNEYPPDLTIVEGGFSRFNASTQAIYKVHGIFQYIYYDISQVYYPPSTIKKIVGFRGNMKKDDLRKIIEQRCDVSFANNDESDSYAVGLTWFISQGLIDWKMEDG